MTLKAFCTTCQRTVYVDGNDTPVCPVCSSPLLETIESREEQPVESLEEEPVD
jgi:Zn finger protein HypA/HybF involved in hydrogenase expression